jgi:hypothetical protein
MLQGDLTRAHARLSEALTISRRGGEAFGMALALDGLGAIARQQGTPPRRVRRRDRVSFEAFYFLRLHHGRNDVMDWRWRPLAHTPGSRLVMGGSPHTRQREEMR